jgi:hypothetical protein
MHDAPDELVMQPAIRVGRENAQSGCAVMFAYAGPPEDGRRHVDDLRQLAAPFYEDYGRMSYQQVQGMNELMPFGLRHYWSGHLLTDLHPETVTAICERLDETQGMNIILLEPISGLARRIDPATAAFPAREARWNVTGMAVWDDPRHDEAQVAWARSISETVLPWSLLGGGYRTTRARRAGQPRADDVRRGPLGPAAPGQADVRPDQPPALQRQHHPLGRLDAVALVADRTLGRAPGAGRPLMPQTPGRVRSPREPRAEQRPGMTLLATPRRGQEPAPAAGGGAAATSRLALQPPLSLVPEQVACHPPPGGG